MKIPKPVDLELFLDRLSNQRVVKVVLAHNLLSKKNKNGKQ